MKITDLTFNIETGMPTCGTAWHQSVKIERMGTISTVGRNTSSILLGSHSGTHMDAPLHFIENGNSIENLDINKLWGEISIVNFRNKKQGDVVTLDDIKKIKISKRMLFVFGWYHYWKTNKYYDKFPFFSVDSIIYLVNKKIEFIAMDTPSPDDGNAINVLGADDSPNHKLLLNNGVIMVEYLNNTDCLDENKKYEIAAFPLRIVNSDGCPARVLIREL